MLRKQARLWYLLFSLRVVDGEKNGKDSVDVQGVVCRFRAGNFFLKHCQSILLFVESTWMYGRNIGRMSVRMGVRSAQQGTGQESRRSVFPGRHNLEEGDC